MTNEWPQADAVRFSEYHQKSKGALIEELRRACPDVMVDEKSSVEGVALSGAYSQGFRNCIKYIEELLVPTQKPEDASNGKFTSM